MLLRPAADELSILHQRHALLDRPALPLLLQRPTLLQATMDKVKVPKAHWDTFADQSAFGICYRHLLHFKSFFLFATIFDGIIWGIASGMYCEDLTASVHWPHSVSITEFGAVGDGATLNTKAFQNEILYLSSFADRGRAKLFVPAGSWLSGEF
ncbi:hypothetical protein ABZP36_000555 [Zizania latifolia]